MRAKEPQRARSYRVLVDSRVALLAGKMVYELRPSTQWDKGKAVEWLYEQIIKECEESVFPVYIGDDVPAMDSNL